MRAAVAGFGLPSSATPATPSPPATLGGARCASAGGILSSRLQVLVERDGGRPDQLEDAPVLGDLRVLLQVQGADVGLQVDHVGVVGIGEVEDAERTGHRRVGT